MRYKAVFRAVDEYGDESLTADTVIEQDDSPQPTGLLDMHGNELYRVRESVAFGFVPLRDKRER